MAQPFYLMNVVQRDAYSKHESLWSFLPASKQSYVSCVRFGSHSGESEMRTWPQYGASWQFGQCVEIALPRSASILPQWWQLVASCQYARHSTRLCQHSVRNVRYLPQLVKGARRARLVMVQRSKKLGFCGSAQTSLVGGIWKACVVLDLRDELAQMLHVVIADLGSTLHDHGGEDDGVQLGIIVLLFVLLAAEPPEELVTEAGVQLVAKGRGFQLLVRIVLVVVTVISGEAHVAFQFLADLEVLVGLEKACDRVLSIKPCLNSLAHPILCMD